MAARRAFIAAPLVGTILFLTAIIYSMNLIRTEEQAAARISDDAYHNKVVSLLALYKADLLSMFSDGLRQNVEDFLIAVDWRGINDVPNLTVSGRLSRCLQLQDVHARRRNLFRRDDWQRLQFTNRNPSERVV